ncbi:MAG: hypothetical protein ABSH04_05090, partial [Acidimicrobiales bacterium]
HRRVRRQEEIIWLRVQGFGRVVSLLPSPHNLAAYDEGELAWSHFPLGPGGETAEVLANLYGQLDGWLGSGECVLVHQEELGDRVMGVVAGYLLWCHRLPGGPQAIAVTERLVGRQIGPQGRDLVAEVVAIGSASPHAGRTSGQGDSPSPAPGRPDATHASEIPVDDRSDGVDGGGAVGHPDETDEDRGDLGA